MPLTVIKILASFVKAIEASLGRVISAMERIMDEQRDVNKEQMLTNVIILIITGASMPLKVKPCGLGTTPRNALKAVIQK